MNIAYFSNQFASASGHGIAHYAHRLYEGLIECSSFNIIPVATGSDRTLENRQKLQEDTNLKLLPWGRKVIPLSWMMLNAPPIEYWLKENIDITHIVSLGFPVATRKKLVVTVHDIGPLTHPEYFTNSKPRLFKLSFEHMVRYADAIICVSQATADEVVGYAGVHLSKRIHVIHEGVDANYFSQEPLDPYKELQHMPPRGIPFMLTAGAMSPRKNIKRVLEAFLKVQDSIPHHLVLVGGTGWDCDEASNMLKNPTVAQKVHHLGYVSDNQLQALYKYADFYLHASLFEGFGLTVLEAMAAGCPVITSNISSLPDIAGDAALFLDPRSIQEIAAAMKSLATDAQLRCGQSERGLTHVKAFQWASTAQKVAAVYQEVGS